MKGYYERTPEADPFTDLADAVNNPSLQQSRKFVDNTEYVLVPLTVVQAVLDVFQDTESEAPEGVKFGQPSFDIEVDTPATVDDEVDHEFEEAVDDFEASAEAGIEVEDDDTLSDEPQHPGYGEDEDPEDVAS